MPTPVDRCHSGARKGPQHRGRRRMGALDLLADLLEDRRRALRGEHAGRDDVAAAGAYVLQRIAQLFAIRGEPAVAVAMAAMIGVAIAVAVAVAIAVTVAVAVAIEEVRERPASHRTSRRVEDAVGDDEEIARVLVEELVGLGVQRVGRRIPHHLVDAHDVAAAAAVAVAHADEEHGAAAHAGDVDRSGEWDREPRLEVEAVQRVDDVDVGAVRRADCTVRLGQAHAEPGLVVMVEEREAVARERPRDRRGEVEQGLDRSGRGERREEEQEADGEDDEAAVQRTHERPLQ